MVVAGARVRGRADHRRRRDRRLVDASSERREVSVRDRHAVGDRARARRRQRGDRRRRGSGPVRGHADREFAFGAAARPPHPCATAMLRISSRCPDTVVGTCHAAYRLSSATTSRSTRTSTGRVRITGLNGSARVETCSGPIAVDGFCGFQLTAPRGVGDVRGAADCSPDRIELRSASGDVHAIVPANPLPRRRQQRPRQRPGAPPHPVGRRPVRRAGDQRHRRRARGGPRMTAIRATGGPRAAAPPARRGPDAALPGARRPLRHRLPRAGRRRLAARRGAQPRLDRAAAAGRRDAARVAARRGRAAAGQPAARRAPSAVPRRPAATGDSVWRRPVTGRSGACWRCCCSSCRSRARAWRSSPRRSRSPSSCSLLAIDGFGGAGDTLRRPVGARARGRARALRAGARRRRGLDRARWRASPACCAPRAGCCCARSDGGGPGARDAGRAARRPLAQHRLLAARPRIFVDERGHPVDLPASGSGRAWTAVEREGNRVAAIVHDAELDATPELVHAAASAAALAIDNERLKADLRARLEELRHSRRRIVEAADDARRQIERDLHDGAQQQLVSLALDLRLLRARLKHEPEVAETVEELADKLASRARGAARAGARHPPGGAVRPRARAGDPRARRARADRRRVRPRARGAAAAAGRGGRLLRRRRGPDQRRSSTRTPTKATVSVQRRSGTIEVVVGDDGIGGARIDAGSGLRGLSDRLAALEGELTLDQPARRGHAAGGAHPDSRRGRP